MSTTPTFDLIAERLGIDDLATWINDHRGHGRSWAWIARHVTRLTRVEVSGEYLRRRFTPSSTRPLSPPAPRAAPAAPSRPDPSPPGRRDDRQPPMITFSDRES